MKSLYKLNWLNIKNNRYILFGIIIDYLWICFAIILSYQSAQEDMAYIWFMYLQKCCLFLFNYYGGVFI